MSGVDGVDGRAEIVARDVGTDHQHFARIHQEVVRGGVHGIRVLGAADHVHVQIGDHLAEVDGRELSEVLGAPQTSLFAAIPQEKDGSLGANAFGGSRGVGMGHTQQAGGTGSVVVGAVVDSVTVGLGHGEANVI